MRLWRMMITGKSEVIAIQLVTSSASMIHRSLVRAE